MKRSLASFAAVVTFCAATAQEGDDSRAWSYRELLRDRRIVHVAVKGTGPGGPFDATLLFSRDAADAGRKPITKGGVTTPPVIVQVCIHDAKKAAPFRLEDFEGPDALATGSKLAKVQLSGSGKLWSHDFVANGWYSNLSVVLNPFDTTPPEQRSKEPLAFVFGLGDAIRDHRELLDLLARIGAKPRAMGVQIDSFTKGGPPLQFDVPLSGASEALKKLMAE